MGRISTFGGALRAALAGAAVALALGGLGATAPAAADGFYMSQGLQPPPYKYRSEYARKSGMYLDLGNVAFVRVPTIRLRVGAVKFREVRAANGNVARFVTGVGYYRPSPATYGRRHQVFVPVKTPYAYHPYGGGAPFYGAPTGYVADYYGRPGYGPRGRLQAEQLGYGAYGFNAGSAIGQLPGLRAPEAYVGSFNAPRQMVPVKQFEQPRPGFQPRFVHFNGATVKSGQLPNLLKPAGKNFIRVE